ncbi:hypothetical protein GH714_043028 [Hevea brasiliensis]|uniref:Msp4/OMP-like domain-containing protein n=1 Tax=Hevea brasiliensis TaxID=3981 RepID=A0A6A6K135_HEVBR|nr:hypothetical protein GH714_043028 [Hevea brasiliensis]
MKPVVCIAAVLCAFSYLVPANSNGMSGRGDFYVSLGYGPAIGTISGFRLNAAKETVAILPYIGKLGSGELSSANYDWAAESTESPVIRFENSSLLGLKGSAGCVVRGTRLEVELGHERYDFKSQKYALLSGGSATFALVKRISASATRDVEGFRAALQKELSKPALESIKKRLEDIRDHDEARESATTTTGTGGTEVSAQGARDKAIADIVTLPLRTRGVIGRAIATSTEGMEIVEISGVRAISAILNACYDFPQVGLLVGWRMSPYACAGLGASFIGLTDRQFQPQLTCKVKAGINYSITHSLAAFIGGTFSKVLGTSYDNTSAHRAVDDASPLGKTKEKISASFGLRNVGVELGSTYADTAGLGSEIGNAKNFECKGGGATKTS